MTGTPACSRWIRWYERVSDRLRGERELSGLALEALQALVSRPPGDPLVECYPLDREVLDRLGEMVGERLEVDLEHHECFLECDAEE